jgi:outer membrane immunogenic protein
MKQFAAVASFLVLSSGSVLAADLPMKAAVPTPYAFSWTGCYVGAHAGGGSQSDSNTFDGSLFFDDFGTGGGTGAGAVAGGQIGCNYQDGNFVIGIEGEGYWSNIKTNSGIVDIDGGLESLTESTKNKSGYTVAGRLGYTIDRTLFYGKGGWAFGQFDFDLAENLTSGGGTYAAFSQSGTLNGLLLGAGIEHAFTPNWTVKLEYDYINYASKSLNLTACGSAFGGGCIPYGSSSEHASQQVVKVGVNYLFGFGGGAVAAKY